MRFDDVPMNKVREGTALTELDAFDLETLSRFEVLRGSGSALHGNDAFHGVLSVQSLSFDESTASASAGFGQSGEHQLSLAGASQHANSSWTAALASRDTGDAGLEYPYVDPRDGQAEPSPCV
jgi:outer membrane cobalamin receptor